MWVLGDLFHDPVSAIKRAKKDASLTGPLLLMAFGAVLLYIAMVVPSIKTGVSSQQFINSFWSTLVLFITVLAYGFLVKVPFEIITDKKQNSLAYTMSANAMWFSLFAIGLLVLSIFGLVGSYIDKPPPPRFLGYASSYDEPIEHKIYQVISGIGLFIFLWFLMRGLSIATRALKELFDTDYLTVLLISGITAMITGIILYIMMFAMFAAMLALMGAGGGLGGGGLGGRGF